MVGQIINDKWETMWKDMILAFLKALLSQHWTRRTEENGIQLQ
jgi:hypothetical protein